jgi:hypothetical protein
MKSENKKSEKEIKTEQWNKLREAIENFGPEKAMGKLNKIYAK